ncbi:C40 family peptidase [Corynebacterium sp.]|uniref:C40 family peptidase n=1 Tax=Corynebacterium sp. TaxID=1720 RepID=UPI0026DB2473|nr:C40 family peptidase [Corynebacterium sp.]MDO5031367.1 NlpC/P60 family protein [Corynebacterium sp.]
MKSYFSRRGLRAAAGTVLVAACVAGTTPAAIAQEAEPEGPGPVAPAEPGADADVARLVEKLAGVAQRVSAKNEEVKGLEDKLAETQRRIDELSGRADAAQHEAEAAAERQGREQQRINMLAQSRYRYERRGPVATVMDSESAGSAVERLGYLGALSAHAQRQLKAKSQATAAARTAHERAQEAVAQAEAEKRALDEQHEQLLRERADLDAQKAEIEAEVDGLSPEQRELWIRHFGSSSDVDIAALIGASGSDAVKAAVSQLGAPYGWGAAGPDAFDCSGLMLWSYQQQGKTIPRTSQAQIAGGTPVPLDQLQPGDIVGYYPGVTHVGMYIGEGKIVHASTYGVPVQVVPVDSMPIQGAARY